VVDERLFLIRVLENQYAALTPSADPETTAQQLAECRMRALRLRQHIRDENLGADLDILYEDYIASLDALTQFWVETGYIKADARERLIVESASSGFNAGVAGASAFGAARGMELGNGEAAGLGILAAGITYFWDAYQKGQERDRAQQEAFAVAVRRLDDQVKTALGRAQNVCGQLGRTHGWKVGEAGFELSEAHAQRVTETFQAGNLDGLVQIAREQADIRPRDPFARLVSNYLRSVQAENDPKVMFELAHDTVSAADLIPSPPVYDEYRLGCISMAASFASGGRMAEIKRGISAYDTTEGSQFAVSLWRQVKALAPQDPTGQIRYDLASALLADNSLGEAGTIANSLREVLKDSDDYAYLCACLAGRLGDAPLGMEWLRRSISLGNRDIGWAIIDPDLEALRVNLPEEFQNLTEIRYDWDIKFGLLSDDIVLTNRSSFPLTNVVLDVDLRQPMGSDGVLAILENSFPLKLSAEVIAPGQSHRWPRAVTIPGSKLSHKSAKLACDQSPLAPASSAP